jgi:hypothetical protein
MFYDLYSKPKYNICEDCYRNFHYQKDSLVKAYKHCILAKVIDPNASLMICCCRTVPRSDANGRPRALFPVNEEDEHKHSMKCGLLKLGKIVAEAKYDGMQTVATKITKRRGKEQLRELLEQDAKARKEEKEKKEKWATRTADHQRRKVEILTQPSLQDSSQKILARGSTPAAAEEEADKDIPFLFRPYTDKYPFGNVHMALRIGPLIIENGVSQ